MSFSTIDVIAVITTYLLFGWLGYLISKKFKSPPSLITWILLIIYTVVAIGILPNAHLVSIFGFNLNFNFALQAAGLGILLGLVIREIKRRETVSSNT